MSYLRNHIPQKNLAMKVKTVSRAMSQFSICRYLCLKLQKVDRCDVTVDAIRRAVCVFLSHQKLFTATYHTEKLLSLL